MSISNTPYQLFIGSFDILCCSSENIKSVMDRLSECFKKILHSLLFFILFFTLFLTIAFQSLRVTVGFLFSPQLNQWLLSLSSMFIVSCHWCFGLPLPLFLSTDISDPIYILPILPSACIAMPVEPSSFLITILALSLMSFFLRCSSRLMPRMHLSILISAQSWSTECCVSHITCLYIAGLVHTL